MADINDLLIRIDASTEQLRREMRRAEKVTDQTTRRIDRALEKVDRGLNNIARRAGQAGAAMLAFAAAGGSVKLIQVARETDILDAQLKTATGSAEAAAISFGMLEDFAARTPFQLREVVDAFVRLKNLGLDPSEEALESYGNTASAMGKTLEQFIEAVADAATAEFERLKEFGIRAKNQGDTIAFTFRGITEEVRNDAREIEAYLRRIGEVEFAGAMAERADSLDGALSNLQDSWDSLFRTISRGPVGDVIESHVRKGISALERLERKVALLQGTATPEQELEEQLDGLFMWRQTLESELSKTAPRSPAFEQIKTQLDEVNMKIEGTKEALKFFQTPLDERYGGAISPVAGPSRTVFPRDIDKKRKGPTFDPVAGALERESTRIQGAVSEVDAFFQSTRTETEQLEAQIARVQELAAQGFFAVRGIDDQEVLRRLEEQLRSLEQKTDETAMRMADSLANNVGGAIDEMFASGEISAESFAEAVLRDLARITTQLYVMKPLIESIFGAGGGSGGFGKALFKAFGFAKGGEFTVGGSGGPDSQFVPLKLSPGEHVKITPPGQKGPSGGIIQNNHFSVAFPPQLQAYIENVAGAAAARQTAAIMDARQGRI